LRIRSRRSSRRWIAALVKNLSEVVWQMWDHRNTVNNEKETATLSIEVNRKIRAEYDQGFRNLSNAAQNLARQPAEELMNKGLQYRQNWLRTMTAHRQYQETLRARSEPPEEILKGPGMVWWIRKGKPSLEEYRAMEF
jgi:hypothetical protein